MIGDLARDLGRRLCIAGAWLSFLANLSHFSARYIRNETDRPAGVRE
jgi:hypothetical protein